MLSNPGDPSSAIGESCKEPKRHTIHFERTRDQDISPQPRLRHRHSLEISSSERLAETYSRGTLLSRSAREGAAAAAGTNFRSKSASPSCEQVCLTTCYGNRAPHTSPLHAMLRLSCVQTPTRITRGFWGCIHPPLPHFQLEVVRIDGRP